MKNKYKIANYPKYDVNKMIPDYESDVYFNGIIDESICFIEDFSLKDDELWERFVNQFIIKSDSEKAVWRGEYWGKMMRGACFTYSYTKSKELYDSLTKTVNDMKNSADTLGRISTYSVDKEFDGWDLWCRKYVLLGMQYYIEICDDDNLIKELIDCMCKQVDYIIDKIGDEKQGKTSITKASRHWRGANSVSILEPIVRLYNITGNKNYFEFAKYIVSTGGTSVENIFNLAYENELYPYQYPVTKAYEMTSCFEGLLEYYKLTGEEKYKTAIINYADKILESDFTIIGSSGCTHELFDHSTVRQANTTNGKIMQETCVTVTLMKFFYELAMLTGNSKYVDAFEVSMYNAFLGAINTNKSIEPTIKELHPDAIIEPLPFDSYSPLTAGTRGNGIGGLLMMPDKHYYGCCACIGSAGTGIISKIAVMNSQSGLVINLYIDGVYKTTTPNGSDVKMITKTEYPKGGKILIKLETSCTDEFEVKFRNPEWSKNTKVYLNKTKIDATDGYISIIKKWDKADEIVLEFDMRTKAIKPIPYGHQVLMNKVVWGQNYVVPTFDKEDIQAKNHIALIRGPIVLAVENRLGYNVDVPFDVKIEDDGYVNAIFPEHEIAPYKKIVEMKISQKDGNYFTVTDYSSAGKLWNTKSKMAAWILISCK